MAAAFLNNSNKIGEIMDRREKVLVILEHELKCANQFHLERAADRILALLHEEEGDELFLQDQREELIEEITGRVNRLHLFLKNKEAKGQIGLEQLSVRYRIGEELVEVPNE
jgi:hypothetical protein